MKSTPLAHNLSTNKIIILIEAGDWAECRDDIKKIKRSQRRWHKQALFPMESRAKNTQDIEMPFSYS